ncbi:MAG TPA: response regulator transcription factor [Actinomycetota bacterium]|nr:response regulator transcription factor [Actinomycetota bacterium]
MVELRTEPVSVAVVDQQPCVARGLAALLAAAGSRFDVAGTFTSLDEARSYLSSLAPAIVLIDIAAGGQVAEDLAREAREEAGSNVVVLSAAEDPRAIRKALELGVRGYLSKKIEVDQLLAALEMVAHGEVVIGPEVVSTLLEAPPAGPVHLTEAELSLLTLVADGYDNSEIIGRMHISESTLKRRIAAITRKLDVQNRVQAAVVATRLGII